MPQILLSSLVILLSYHHILCQPKEENLIPNPGFEEYSGTPLGWFFTGKDFTRVMKYWESPTAASPDVYGPRVRVPAMWQERGFGKTDAHGGESCIGITVYGCEGGKPHCREYIQIQMTESLVPGQRYLFEFWYKPLPRSLRIDRVGAFFSEDRISSLTDEVLNFAPQCASSALLDPRGLQWEKFAAEFVAEETSNYLIIGNFWSDELTNTRQPNSNALNFGYLYLDDVLLKKLEPILEVPTPDDDLSRIELKEGQKVELKNIYFDYDKAEFLPRSYRELHALVQRMYAHPKMMIEVMGHTDNQGTDEYNEQLSISRAKAVVDFLIQEGIDQERLKFSGYGSKIPVTSNATEYGRQMNRRVEFLVLEY